jgi:hypothetical protein
MNVVTFYLSDNSFVTYMFLLYVTNKVMYKRKV